MDEPSQHQTVSGAGSAAAQVIGDGNTVNIVVGGAKLALDRLHTRKTNPTSIIELLRVDVRATSLVGRTDELAALAKWRDGPDAIAVRCIIGQAGAGKTRLAVEACEAAEARGWAAAFVRSDELKRFHEANNLIHWRLDKDTLIVLDYAATSLPILKTWFELLAPHRNAADGRRLRILLLERHAEAEAGWWADLSRRESRSQAGAADLIAGEVPVRLTPPDALEDRRALLAEAMKLAAPLLEPPRSPLVPPLLGANAWFDRQLANPRIENGPLYLLMAGVHAAGKGVGDALALTADKLAQEMADIETARLKRFAQARGFADQGAAILHLAACITLQNGCPLDGLVALVDAEMGAMSLQAGVNPEATAHLLCDGLSEVDGKIDAIRPDMIGEAFMLRMVKGDRLRSDEAARRITLRAYRRDPTGVIATLIRCACDHAGGQGTHPAVQWLQAIADETRDLSDLYQIADSLPEQTLSLREFATTVTSRIVSILRESRSAETRQALAGSLNNLAGRLSDLGQREAALDAAQEAVSLYRTLAAQHPDAFTHNLAMSLNNLANRLSDLGQREDALDAAQEAVSLRRTLATQRPDAFTPNLSASLNNLANFLSDLGQREAALDAAQEAVSLYRTLAAQRPDAFRPDLAMSLNNLASFLSALGQREAALDAAQEAISLYRTLAAQRPDAFTPDLALSLNNLASFLSALGQREAALDAAQEAVSLRRNLAAQRPDAFTPKLAMSLNNLATFLSDLGQREAALDAAQEAVSLYRPLAAQHPDAFTPNLAGSLNNLANFLSALGQREAALDAAQEAVSLYRTLAAQRPDAFRPDLAMSLNNLANRLSDPGQREAALDAAQEAASLYRTLAAQHPDAFTPNLAGSLNNLAIRLSTLGQREAALDAAQEAISLYRTLAAQRPDAFTPDLAMSLNNLASFLSDLGQREAALDAAQEVVSLYRTLAAQHPDAFTPNLARSLGALGMIFEADQEIANALESVSQGIEFLRQCFLASHLAHGHLMMPLVRDYLRRAEMLDVEPDETLLGPILEPLLKLFPPTDDDPEETP